MPHTIRKNARAWQRLWRGGEIITEIDGDNPGMPQPVSWVAQDQIDRIIYR